MEHILINGVPLSETIGTARQKFMQIYGHQELHITACAVSKMAGVDRLPELKDFENFFVEPNQKWQENPANERAWVKVYYKLNPKTDSAVSGLSQIIIIPMPFLGESSKECWGEIQLMIKKQTVRNGRMTNLETVKLGRHQCYDTRVGSWVPEAKPIIPKKDTSTHGYVALRLYHHNNLPENHSGWHFEPVYVSVAGENFYRIDAEWDDEKIVIIATPLDGDSSEIPEFLKQ